MKLKLLYTLLPLLVLCACASNPQQTRNPFLAATRVLFLPDVLVVELPEVVMEMPESNYSLSIAHSYDEVIATPAVDDFYYRCGWMRGWLHSLQYWSGLQDVPHIKFTVVSGHLTWIPVEGRVHHHLRMRIDGGQGESALTGDQLFW